MSTPAATPTLLPAPDGLRLSLFARSADVTRQALARAARDDFPDWLHHVRAASTCARPVRLAGTITTYHQTGTGTAADPYTYQTSTVDTARMPDGTIYKACGNRRASVCPACSETYRRDAYHIIRAGIAGGMGVVPDTARKHPATFSTFTAPSFGPVHHRVVKTHTCRNRDRCDCRAEPCHPDRTHPVCPHSNPLVCWARHERGDKRLGTPLCAECYDYDGHAVWNNAAGELWRRTKQAIDRHLAKLCRTKAIPRVTVGVDPGTGRRVTTPAARTSCGKAAEFQQRAVVHFHALIRLDGRHPDDPAAIVPPPDALTVEDLQDAITTAARSTAFRTPPHPDNPAGWLICWGHQQDNQPITISGNGQVTDEHAAGYLTKVAGYLAKYATKSTEATGHTSTRITEATIGRYADTCGNHIQRLLAACWRLGRPHQHELHALAYQRLLNHINTLGLQLGRLDPDDTDNTDSTGSTGSTAATQAHTDTQDRLHTMIGELVDLAETAPKPLHRQPHTPPTGGAVRRWVCPACGASCSTTRCQACLAAQHERSRRRQRLLFLLLLTQTIDPPEQDTNPYAGLRRWCHMLGFGGHFFSQSARYSARFQVPRQARITFRRNENNTPNAQEADADRDGQETTLVINTLTMAGIGWHTTADAILAQTSSALAREHQQLARHLIHTLTN